MKTLTLLVAQMEQGETLVAGAWETVLLDIIGADEVESLFHEAKLKWAPQIAGDSLAWREVHVNVRDDELLAAFSVPTLVGKVVP